VDIVPPQNAGGCLTHRFPPLKIRNLLRLPNILLETDRQSLETLLTETTHPQAILPEKLHGQFSLCVENSELTYLIRDRLGINKLFYHIDATSGTLTVGNFLHEVAAAVKDFNGILSVPPGHFLKIDSQIGTRELVSYYDISKAKPQSAETFDLQVFQKTIHSRLSRYFRKVRNLFPDSLFCVCLSGGLDSSLIASYASDLLDSPVAVTFSYQSESGSGTSEDFSAASAIATHLDMPFIPVLVKKEVDPEVLDLVLRNGQDWRDFNVHCAWVNDHIGQEVRRRFPDRDIVFLTGDLMNEYVADYTPVTYKGSVYYPQPNVSRERLRRFLVYGLDTSDREVGIFHHSGITTLQPYSILAEEYLRVPHEILDAPGSKERLNFPLITNPGVRESLVKTKVRAQVGGSDGGTLGLFHDSQISQDSLKERWAQLFAGTTGNEEMKPIIISGRYRSN
jgi:hypothetical protein